MAPTAKALAWVNDINKHGENMRQRIEHQRSISVAAANWRISRAAIMA